MCIVILVTIRGPDWCVGLTSLDLQFCSMGLLVCFDFIILFYFEFLRVGALLLVWECRAVPCVVLCCVVLCCEVR